MRSSWSRSRFFTHASALAWVGLWLGCQTPSPPVESATEAATPRVEYNGCFATVEDACVIFNPHENRRLLSLWIWPSTTSVTVESPNIEWPAAPTEKEPIQGGDHYLLYLPAGTYDLLLRLRHGDQEVEWRLEILEVALPALFEDISSGKEQIFDRAQAATKQDLPPAHLGFAHWVSAILLEHSGSDEPDAIYAHLRQAIAFQGKAGYYLDQVASAEHLSRKLLYDGAPDLAREVIESMPARPREPGLARFRRAYQRGLVAAHTGDSRNALRLLSAAVRQAERLDFAGQRRDALQILASQLQLVGRSSEAGQILDQLAVEFELATEAGEANVCEQVQLLDNQAWHRLIELESGRQAANPLPKLLEARRLRDGAGCTSADQEKVNQATNLALAYLHAGQPEQSTVELAKARRLTKTIPLWQVFWWKDIEARIALEEARAAQSLVLYEELAAAASSSYMPDVHIRVALGRARALRALGRDGEARRVLADSETLLEEAALQVPIDMDRAGFLGRREASTRLYLQLLLESGDSQQAWTVARLARSRVLRGLLRDVRLARLDPQPRQRWQAVIDQYLKLSSQLDNQPADDWQLAADELQQREGVRQQERQQLKALLDQAYTILEGGSANKALSRDATSLPALQPDEVRLLYHPLPQGWVGFAETQDGLKVEILEQVDPQADLESLAEKLLLPFADQIEGVRTVRVLPYGALRLVDFQALPLAGEPLLAKHQVVYGLDLPSAPRPEDGTQRIALVVADPTGDLPYSRAEARSMHQALGLRYQAKLLEGSSAHGDAVRRGLSESDFFYYAGHGVWASWESSLPLSGGSRLEVGDVLALPRVPQQVILSACETARSPAGAAESVAGMAQALLTAGSQQVVAATRPVDDQLAADLMAILQREWATSADLSAALRQAQLQIRQQRPEADWASFRILER